MRGTAGALSVLALLAVGCAETTWTWTLNPDGSGKVEVDARLQPTFDVFGASFGAPGGKSDPFKDEPEDLARRAAARILAKSKGVAAWKDVSSGVAPDGRLSFKGTAYFDDLAEAEIKGDPFPTGLLKPKLSRDEGEGGRLVLGLQIRRTDKQPGADEDGEADAAEEGAPTKASDEPTEEEVTIALTKGKVAYQTVKPVATAFLSTMRTEIVVRLPGEVVEISNFTKDEDGALHLVFDGPRLLEALDELAETDAARWREFALKMKQAMESGERPEETLLWETNELVFGEKGPVRAVVGGELEPLFDYVAELEEAKANAGGLVRKLGLDASTPESAWQDYWGVSGAALASARTDSGTGLGWAATLTGGDKGGPFFWQLDVSRVGYEEDGFIRDLVRIVVSGGDSSWSGPVIEGRIGGGVGLSFGEGDIWAVGPRALCDVGFFGERSELYLELSAYLWLGERDDAFDVDVEADARVVAGLRF